MRLKEQVAIVTGGGSGIGQASALLFAREGARVAIVDRELAAAEDAAARIQADGGEAMAFGADVGAPGTAEANAAAVLAQWGRIDVLMCAAGFSCGGTVLTTAPEDWDAVFRTNVGGTWVITRDLTGRIVSLADPGGGTTNISYDGLGRPIQYQAGADVITLVYDAGGNLIEHDTADTHWIMGQPPHHPPITNPMSPFPKYSESRGSWGVANVPSVVVEIEQEDGLVGVGMSTGGEAAAFIIEHHLAMFVEGQVRSCNPYDSTRSHSRTSSPAPA